VTIQESEGSNAFGGRLRVSETFVSIQGEAGRAGRPTFFLRLTGCALRCRWCDSTWAFAGGKWLEVEDIRRQILDSHLPSVCVTGGEPLLQPAVIPLLERLAKEDELDVVVETGGDQDISVLPASVHCVLDIKLPSSGMEERMRRENWRRLRTTDEVKFVIADRGDYEAARRHLANSLHGFGGRVFFGAVEGMLKSSMLAEWIISDRLDVALQLQMHKILWPGRERGV